jgi:hypothetical protein
VAFAAAFGPLHQSNPEQNASFYHPPFFLSFRPRAVSLAVRKDAARRRDILSRVNIVKRIKIGGRW